MLLLKRLFVTYGFNILVDLKAEVQVHKNTSHYSHNEDVISTVTATRIYSNVKVLDKKVFFTQITKLYHLEQLIQLSNFFCMHLLKFFLIKNEDHYQIFCDRQSLKITFLVGLNSGTLTINQLFI